MKNPSEWASERWFFSLKNKTTPQRIKIAKWRKKTNKLNSINKMHDSKFKIVLSNVADKKRSVSQASLRV